DASYNGCETRPPRCGSNLGVVRRARQRAHRPHMEGGMVARQCLVTGGAGFIGSHLVEQLLQENWRVRVLDDFSTGKLANLEAVLPRIELVRGSITDPAAARAGVADCDVVFHLAALPSVARSLADPVTSHTVCATGTLQVLDAARRAAVRRVVYA